jgi:hypothetical protein
MKTFAVAILIASTQLVAQQVAAETKRPRLVGVIEVGEVFTDCDHVTRAKQPAATPIGFTITPNDAFKLAHDQGGFRCPSKFGHTIYADHEYYYITVGLIEAFLSIAKLDITPDTLREHTFRVHGKSGKVILPTKQ